jgi:hypothetical protein
MSQKQGKQREGEDKSSEAAPSAVVERLAWQTATRDDQQVAQAIHAGHELDAMHELSEAGLLDEFVAFLEEVGVMKEIEQLNLPGVERVLIPAVQFVLLYLLKVLFGVESMNSLPQHLFSNVGLMQLVGFNATQVQQGFTKRGDGQRKTKRKQGPLTPQCLANNICKLTGEQMEAFFNRVVQGLVGASLLTGDLVVALDGSKLETPATYEGCGCVKVERQLKRKGSRELVTVEEYLHGWKVLVLIEVQTRLPLAMKVVKIQEYEGQWLLPLVKQAQANLGQRARISKVVIDRGYLDGEDLWGLHQQGIIFVVVAKTNMAVTQDAQALAARAKSRVREQVVRHGHGKTATTETLRTKLVGIEALTTYDAYGDEEHERHKYRRDFVGHPINAVVVRLWNNRQPSEGGTVYLTNGPVADPFVVFDDYDWRSVIENGIFKEGKHPWLLERFPQKTEAAVVVHAHFTLAVMALCTAFRLSQAREATVAASPAAKSPSLNTTLLGGEGTARWRRRLKEENRDKVLVFVGDAYGIFHLAELAILSGIRLSLVPPHLGSRQDILARYGLSP